MITFRALDMESMADLRYVKELVKCTLCEDTQGIVAERDGKRVAVVVFDSWTNTAVNVHYAIVSNYLIDV